MHNFPHFPLLVMARFFSIVAVLSLVLSGCGGGGGGFTSSSGSTSSSSSSSSSTASTTVTQTVTGTVATGLPLSGATIKIKDSKGNIATGTTKADGTFSIIVAGTGVSTSTPLSQPPFMFAAIPACPSGQNCPQNLYSILAAMDMTSTNTQRVNITPVTTLVMYELNGGTDPSSMYNGVSYATLAAGTVLAKEAAVRSELPTLSPAISSAVSAVNPIFDLMHDQFSADGTGYDAVLDQLGSITNVTTTAVTFAKAVQYLPVSSKTSTGTGSAVATPSITLALRDVLDTTNVTTLSSSKPILVKATVKDANGAAVSSAIVVFSTNATYAAFSGGDNTALTDSNGIAEVTLTTANTSGGASTVLANTTVSGTAISGSVNYAVGVSSIGLGKVYFGSIPSATDTTPYNAPPTPTTLSAYGTTSVSVAVLDNTGSVYTTPLTVNFSSACASTHKATLTTSVSTINGIATASYLDNGCNNQSPGDTITVTLSNGGSMTGYLPVNTPSLGSIQFVSAVTTPVTTPVVITLKGMGGTGRSETARVTFRVVDNAGNPVGGQTVYFSLNTSLGGLQLGSYSGLSDPTTGNVVTQVISGTISTPVRVTAAICTGNTTKQAATVSPTDLCNGWGGTPLLSSQSDQLTISTGIPSQEEVSLPVTVHNIEGWAYDGVTTTLTAMLADHFRNPVPDGTAVYFTSEGGSVTPSCTTTTGTCNATVTSQSLRPTNGRVTVLARAIGEEAFTDGAGGGTPNGTCDSAAEMIDANGMPTDMPEAFVDYNENGIRDANEPYFDFNGNNQYDGPQYDATGTFIPYIPPGTPGPNINNYSASFYPYTPGLVVPTGANLGQYTGDAYYNGVLCTANSPTNICGPTGTPRSIDVRASNTIIFSGSYVDQSNTVANPMYAGAASVVKTNGAGVPNLIDLPPCTNAGAGAPVTLTIRIVDLHGNAMPAGTTVVFSSDGGLIANPNYTIPDTTGCRSAYTGCPPLVGSTHFGEIPVSIRSNDTWSASAGCSSVNGSSGTLTITVTTPKGNVSTPTIPVIEQ